METNHLTECFEKKKKRGKKSHNIGCGFGDDVNRETRQLKQEAVGMRALAEGRVLLLREKTLLSCQRHLHHRRFNKDLAKVVVVRGGVDGESV